MIRIEKPQIVSDSCYATLSTFIDIDGVRKELWFRVEKEFEQYLCYERGDAYVIAVLNYAMRNHHDIECAVPISEDIYYNIDKYLIDALAVYNKKFYRPIISAEVGSELLPCAGVIGTGISCGVDSMHSLACETGLKYKKHNITHLTFNNVGSHGNGRHAEELFQQRLKRAKRFAEEYGFALVQSDSNLQDVIEQSHFKTHTYSSMFAVYCLQKLYSVYYYASGGYKYHEFNLVDYPNSSCGSYEMLSLPLFSTHSLRVYSEGEGMSRLTKLRDVVKYRPSYKYLNVCLVNEDNCGKCEKCVRTILGLDAIGKLDKYSEVFDVQYYHVNQQWYFKQMLKQMYGGKHDYFEIYPYLSKRISIWTRIQTIPSYFYIKLQQIMPNSVRSTKIYKALRDFKHRDDSK